MTMRSVPEKRLWLRLSTGSLAVEKEMLILRWKIMKKTFKVMETDLNVFSNTKKQMGSLMKDKQVSRLLVSSKCNNSSKA